MQNGKGHENAEWEKKMKGRKWRIRKKTKNDKKGKVKTKMFVSVRWKKWKGWIKGSRLTNISVERCITIFIHSIDVCSPKDVFHIAERFPSVCEEILDRIIHTKKNRILGSQLRAHHFLDQAILILSVGLL